MTGRIPLTGITIVMMMAFGNCDNPAGKGIDLQGHRGCRGLLPENTVQGFLKALDMGVTTLEMDLAVSKDGKVVVSHEPYFSHEISNSPDGVEITQAEEKTHNIYQLTYDQIKAYGVGSRPHSRFPQQKRSPASKPLLAEVITKADAHAANEGRRMPFYNLEIKRRPEWDSLFHPPAGEFAKLVVAEVHQYGIGKRVCIQSFDVESLKAVKRLAPSITIAQLVENNDSFEGNLLNLGFMPHIYSPYYKLVDESLAMACREKGIPLVPWTVNTAAEVEKLLQLGVDGIITDYPRMAREVILQKGFRVK